LIINEGVGIAFCRKERTQMKSEGKEKKKVGLGKGKVK
jgi:hypothetical protein